MAIPVFETAPSGKSPKSHSHGVGGFIGNVLGDVRDSVVGIPGGVKALVEHPIGGAKAIGETTWHDWSPLFHGQYGKFVHQVYDHPLAPLLDVATVFTLGEGALAKGATALSEAGKAGKVIDALKYGQKDVAHLDVGAMKLGRTPEPAVITKTSAKPVKRAVQLKAHDLSAQWANHLPKWFTPQAAYERLALKRSVGREQGMIRGNANAAAAEASLKQLLQGSGLTQEAAQQLAGNGATTAFLTALTQGGKTLSESEAIVTPYLLQQLHNNVILHGIEFDPFKRQLNGHILTKTKNLKTPGGVAYTQKVPQLKAMPEGWDYIHRLTPDFQKDVLGYKAGTPIENRLNTIGDKLITTDINSAHMIKNGQRVLIAQNRTLKDLGAEGARSSTFLKWWYRYPTRVWKMGVVGYSPKVVVNNGVGNYTMYLMRQGGQGAFRGLYDAYSYTKGERRARKDLTATAARYLNPHVLNKHFLDEMGQSYFGSTLQDAAAKGASLKTDKLISLRGGFYGAVHRYADQPIRAASLAAYLRRAPEVKALMAKGHDFWTAADKALSNGTKGQTLRQATANHAKDIAGDYNTLSQSEKAIRDLMPFYLWSRHALRHFRNLATERPAAIALAQAVSHHGIQQTQAKLGQDIPGFLLGDISMGKGQDGRARALSTQGLNPYATVSDLSNLGAALTTGHATEAPGEVLGGETSAILSGLIEAATGKRIGTDSNVPQHGGVIPTAAINVSQSIPLVSLLQAFHKPKGRVSSNPNKPTLYTHSLHEVATNLVGFPEKDIDLSRAAQLEKQDHPHKKRKYKSGIPVFG